MRIAVVDVGSNTTRLYIAEVVDGQVAAELTRLGRVTRLGAGVDGSGRLASDALAREYTVLDEYHQLIKATGAPRSVAVMTSAVRDAANGREFAEDVASRFGLEVHMLSGDEEAQLTYIGTTDQLEQHGEGAATLVFDRWLLGHPEIPEPQRNLRLGPWEIDCYWPEHELALELDGRPYHTVIDDIERDRRKDAWLQRHGIRILRVTDSRFRRDKPGVYRDLTALLAVGGRQNRLKRAI